MEKQTNRKDNSSKEQRSENSQRNMQNSRTRDEDPGAHIWYMGF